MNRIAEVARLKGLEAKAVSEPWVTEESDEGHEIRMGEAIETRGQYATHHLMEYNHGCVLFEDSTKSEETQYIEAEANAYLISEMRNAAPWLLAVAGQFQAGHAAALAEIADILEQAGFVAKAAYVRPLIEAARVMEGEQ